MWQFMRLLTLLRLLLELLLEVIEQVGVEILATQVSVTSGGLDGEDTTLDVKEGDIESTSAEIVDHDIPLLLRLASTETVCNGCGSWLVDDTEYVEASNGTGILGRLSLVVVEVCGHGDNGLGDLLAELRFGDLLHLCMCQSPEVDISSRAHSYLAEDHG